MDFFVSNLCKLGTLQPPVYSTVVEQTIKNKDSALLQEALELIIYTRIYTKTPLIYHWYNSDRRPADNCTLDSFKKKRKSYDWLNQMGHVSI